MIHSLLEGLGNYDCGADLKRRLHMLPEHLENLYWHMLDRVKPTWYLQQTFRLLLIVKNAFQSLTVLQLAYADMQDSDLAVQLERNGLSLHRQWWECEGMMGRIKSRCLGIIEVSGSTEIVPSLRTVRFLHKSVEDFRFS